MILRPLFTPRLVTFVTIAAAVLGIAPTVAEAQARGTLQVSAQVVSTESAFRTLEAARAAVSSVNVAFATRGQKPAPTVARVSVTRNPQSLIVTIDYSRS